MSVLLYRLDDRLVHGQVVVGWGQPLRVGFIGLVDDTIRASAWEQDLYRMSVPPHIELLFASVAEARERLAGWEADPRPGIVVVGALDALAALARNGGAMRRVNLGGLHQRPGRSPRLPYLYLSDAEAALLKEIAAHGVEITAQDVPTARPVPLAEFA